MERGRLPMIVCVFGTVCFVIFWFSVDSIGCDAFLNAFSEKGFECINMQCSVCGVMRFSWLRFYVLVGFVTFKVIT